MLKDIKKLTQLNKGGIKFGPMVYVLVIIQIIVFVLLLIIGGIIGIIIGIVGGCIIGCAAAIVLVFKTFSKLLPIDGGSNSIGTDSSTDSNIDSI
jgi:hypothetical protein